jgi:hypothetical protein
LSERGVAYARCQSETDDEPQREGTPQPALQKTSRIKAHVAPFPRFNLVLEQCFRLRSDFKARGPSKPLHPAFPPRLPASSQLGGRKPAAQSRISGILAGPDFPLDRPPGRGGKADNAGFSHIILVPLREQNPMQTTQLPDLSVDFMTWLNRELRKHIDGPETDEEESHDRGFVNRLKTYFGRPVVTETV